MANRTLIIRRQPRTRSGGIAIFGNRRLKCRLGRSGMTVMKREGDGATPIGRWPVLRVLYRADRLARPRCGFPVRAIHPSDGWCDAPFDRNYNRPVPLPYPASAETLWRADHLYDLVLVVDINISRRRHGRGSAIFVHLTGEDDAPTQGCIAFAERDLRYLLRHLGRAARLHVRA